MGRDNPTRHPSRLPVRLRERGYFRCRLRVRESGGVAGRRAGVAGLAVRGCRRRDGDAGRGGRHPRPVAWQAAAAAGGGGGAHGALLRLRDGRFYICVYVKTIGI